MTSYDVQFNLRRRHPLGRLHLLKNELQSVYVRWTLKHSLDVAYGQSPGEKIDLFPSSNPGAPVFVFIHGGYFRALDKRQYRYLARPWVRAGCTVALVNYDLAPTVTVGEIVEQNLKAFAWIRENVGRWNGDPENILLCGHSVGAFLVAKILESEVAQGRGASISGAALLSGLYDLTKMKLSYLNESLRLTDDDVANLSPAFGKTDAFPPCLVAVGDDETDEFIAQSEAYFEKLQRSGGSHDHMLLENKNHYSVSRMLSHWKNPLMEKLAAMSGAGGHG